MSSGSISRRSIGRASSALAAVLLWAGLVGLGGNQGGGEVTDPEEVYAAVFVDIDGTTIEVSGINVSGEVSLVGQIGRGNLRVRLANIGAIDFTDNPGDFSTAVITLTDGKSVDLLVRDSLAFYGQTGSGLYQIRTRDLQSVRIQH